MRFIYFELEYVLAADDVLLDGRRDLHALLSAGA